MNHLVLLLLSCLVFNAPQARALDSLPFGSSSTITNYQLAQIGHVYLSLHEEPYQAIDRLYQTNMNLNVGGLSSDGILREFRRVAFNVAQSATTNHLVPTHTFRLLALAQAGPFTGFSATSSARIYVSFTLESNGAGGWRLPADNTQDSLPVIQGAHVLISGSSLIVTVDSGGGGITLNPAMARIIFRDVNGNPTSQIGTAVDFGTYSLFPNGFGASPSYPDIVYFNDNQMLGISTNYVLGNTRGELVLSYTTGVKKYNLTTGVRMDILQMDVVYNNAQPRLTASGEPNRSVVVESAATLPGPWVAVTTNALTFPRGEATLTNTGPIGARFYRARYQ